MQRLVSKLTHKRRKSKKQQPQEEVTACGAASDIKSSSSSDRPEDDDDNLVFYDCLSFSEPPAKRTFPLSLAKNHTYVTPEEYLALKSTNPTKLYNTYSEPPASQFQVRGPDYLSQHGKNCKHLKVPSQESAYEVIGVSMYRCPKRFTHMSKEIQPLREFFDAQTSAPHGADPVFPKFLVINWIVAPLFGKESHVCSHVFQLKEHIVKNKPYLRDAFQKFRSASDEEKSKQFKWLGKIVEGPRAITATMSALGAERPVLICNQLTTTYCTGQNYIEITNDVSSSRIAAANCGTILRNLNSVVMDMAWVLEGQQTEHLPENLLCSIRWIWNNLDDLVINLDENGELVT